MVKSILFICVLSVGLIACKPYTLQFEQKPYSGDVRTDGYYYNMLKQEDKTLTRMIFLYDNGVTFRMNFATDDLRVAEERLLDTVSHEQVQTIHFQMGYI